MKSTTKKAVENNKYEYDSSKAVIEEQSCFGISGIQTEVKKNLNDNDAATMMDEITDVPIHEKAGCQS